MKKQVLRGLLVTLSSAALVLTGCGLGATRDSSSTSADYRTDSERPTAVMASGPLTVPDTFLKDIPVPSEYRLVEDQTYLFETKNGMILAGRVFDGRIATESIVAIYRREMPRNGWALDSTSITSNQINKLYHKDGAMALITISSRFGGSTVSIRYASLNPRSSAAAPASRPASTPSAGTPSPQSPSAPAAADRIPQPQGIIYIDDLNP